MLHALLDILPYPVGPNGMWYEIKTGSVRCVDEVENIDGEDEDDEFPGLGRLEEGVPEMRERWSVSLKLEGSADNSRRSLLTCMLSPRRVLWLSKR